MNNVKVPLLFPRVCYLTIHQSYWRALAKNSVFFALLNWHILLSLKATIDPATKWPNDVELKNLLQKWSSSCKLVTLLFVSSWYCFRTVIILGPLFALLSSPRLSNHSSDTLRELLHDPFITDGGLPCEKGIRHKFWKEPIRGAKILFWGRGFEVPTLKQQINWHALFRLSTLKVSEKAPAGDRLRLNTLRGTKPGF